MEMWQNRELIQSLLHAMESTTSCTWPRVVKSSIVRCLHFKHKLNIYFSAIDESLSFVLNSVLLKLHITRKWVQKTITTNELYYFNFFTKQFCTGFILLALTHSLTAALDQLRVVASSTSNDPGPRSRQHQHFILTANILLAVRIKCCDVKQLGRWYLSCCVLQSVYVLTRFVLLQFFCQMP